MPSVDVLIIGSGVAGLATTIKLAERFPARAIGILSKDKPEESNTRYAQGGIATVTDFEQDSLECHVEDTLLAGAGLCDPFVVNRTIREAPARLKELMKMGVDFDRTEKGELMLAREGGHQANRIVHCQDKTGLVISRSLLQKVETLSNVIMLDKHVALDLLMQVSPMGEKTCVGAYVLNTRTNEIQIYRSLVTVLATGGLGQLYRVTTNPFVATGDGIAMAHRVGAAISNMEFIQFHPTAMAGDEETTSAFLISEAVRGHGAYLKNKKGERFLFHHHPSGELACRDVVAKAIASELYLDEQQFVYLDCTHIADNFEDFFPTIHSACAQKGIDVKHDFIPVGPAAHYVCGGIDVDLHGRTSIQHLYACGECSNTGLHGANRLASNSLLEALVYAHACFLDIERNLAHIKISEEGVDYVQYAMDRPHFSIPSVRLSLQNLMTKYVGITRCNDGLRYALQEINTLEKEMRFMNKPYYFSPSWCETRNMITCAKLIVEQSLVRRENRGVFFNRDL